jgi:uncharacterized protein YggT (Ycf19 family)
MILNNFTVHDTTNFINFTNFYQLLKLSFQKKSKNLSILLLLTKKGLNLFRKLLSSFELIDFANLKFE